MRFLFLVIFWWPFAYPVKAQDTLHHRTIKDSSKTVHLLIYKLPTEFGSNVQVNEYYSTSIFNHEDTSIFRLGDDCRFIYKIPKGSTRIDLAVGKYHVSGDTIFFEYEPLPRGDLPDTIIQDSDGPVTYKRGYESPLAVSWMLPNPPKYLVIYRDKLYPVSQEKLKTKEFYSLRGKLQFDIRKCK